MLQGRFFLELAAWDVLSEILLPVGGGITDEVFAFFIAIEVGSLEQDRPHDDDEEDLRHDLKSRSEVECIEEEVVVQDQSVRRQACNNLQRHNDQELIKKALIIIILPTAYTTQIELPLCLKMQ